MYLTWVEITLFVYFIVPESKFVRSYFLRVKLFFLSLPLTFIGISHNLNISSKSGSLKFLGFLGITKRIKDALVSFSVLGNITFTFTGWASKNFNLKFIDTNHNEIKFSDITLGIKRTDVARARGFGLRNSGFQVFFNSPLSDFNHMRIEDGSGNILGRASIAGEFLNYVLPEPCKCKICADIGFADDLYLDGLYLQFTDSRPKTTANLLKLFLLQVLFNNRLFPHFFKHFIYKELSSEDRIHIAQIINKFSLGNFGLELISSGDNAEYFSKLKDLLNKDSKLQFLDFEYETYRDYSSFLNSEPLRILNDITYSNNFAVDNTNKLVIPLSDDLSVSLISGVSNYVISDSFQTGRSGFKVTPNYSRIIEKGLILPSYVPENFFHFLMESMIGLSDLPASNFEDYSIILSSKMHKNLLELLRVIGYSKFIFVEKWEKVLIKNCIILKTGYVSMDAIERNINSYKINKDGFLNLRNMLINKLIDNVDSVSQKGKISLIRTTGRRSVTNRIDVINRLESLDYEICDPANSSVVEIANRVYSSKRILIEGGAAIANLIFAQPGTEIVYLTSYQLRDFSMPKVIADILDLRINLVTGHTSLKKIVTSHTLYDYFHADYSIDIKNLTRFL